MASYGVVVGFGGHLRKGIRRMGVARARSAVARRWRGVMWWRRWCSKRSRVAARVLAMGMGQGVRWSRMARAMPAAVIVMAIVGRWLRARRVMVWTGWSMGSGG